VAFAALLRKSPLLPLGTLARAFGIPRRRPLVAAVALHEPLLCALAFTPQLALRVAAFRSEFAPVGTRLAALLPNVGALGARFPRSLPALRSRLPSGFSALGSLLVPFRTGLAAAAIAVRFCFGDRGHRHRGRKKKGQKWLIHQVDSLKSRPPTNEWPY